MELTKVKEKLTENHQNDDKIQFKPVLKCLMSFMGGFLFVNPFILTQLSPFSVSLVTALRDACSLWAAAGGIFGSFVFFDGTQTVRYIAIFFLCILIKGVSAKLIEKDAREIIPYINAFSSPLIISSAVMLATGFDSEEMLGILCESVLSAVGTYVFQRTAQTVWDTRDVSRYTTSEYICIILTLGISVMHFYRYTIFNFSPIMIIFSLATLIASRVKGSYGGAVCGICLSVVTGISGDFGFSCLEFAIGGLLSGEFIRKNRFISCGTYILPALIFAVADGKITAYFLIPEAVAACVIFLLLPDSFYNELCKRANAPVPVYIRDKETCSLSERLIRTSDAIAKVSDCVTTVQQTLTPDKDKLLHSVIIRAWENTCVECELKESCRTEVKTPAPEDIDRLASALINHAVLDETRFPKGFKSSCYSFDEMISKLQKQYSEYTAMQIVQGQVIQAQQLMSDQFRNVSDILQTLALDFSDEININTEAADSCAAEAKEFGLHVIKADSYLDKLGRIIISLTVQRPEKDFNITALTEGLSDIIGTPLNIPELDDNDTVCKLTFRQKIICSVSIGAYSTPLEGEKVCGDYFRSFRDENNRYIVILSDGMGTGGRAAIDSAMASELFSKQIKAGMTFDCALSVSNSAMLVKGSDESLATLDVLCFDPYTGRADFFKAGAAVTFIKHRNTVIPVESASLPLGILREVEFAKNYATLEKGDILLMVSDGVSGDHYGWIQQELKLWTTEEAPQRLAEFIVNSALERRLGKHRDDMTAIAIYIE